MNSRWIAKWQQLGLVRARREFEVRVLVEELKPKGCRLNNLAAS